MEQYAIYVGLVGSEPSNAVQHIAFTLHDPWAGHVKGITIKTRSL